MDEKHIEGEEEAPLSRHHYDFGHVVLREACGFNPLAFFQVMASPEREEFLQSLWKAVCERCDDIGPAWFSIEEVGFDSLLLADYPTILVTMPSPRVMTEAYYVAVVLLTPMEQIVAGNIPELPSFGYYTLELGIGPSDIKYTMLCSWEDGKHLNFGNGPQAETAAFLQAVAEKLPATA